MVKQENPTAMITYVRKHNERGAVILTARSSRLVIEPSRLVYLLAS